MTKKEQQFIELLDKWELDIFSIQSLKRDYGIELTEWKSTLRQLIKIGYLKIIEREKYCRHYFSDEHVIGNYLVPDGVVAYWSALNLHGLTEQFTNTVFVQTTKLKKEKWVFGVRYKFIKVLPRKMAGIKLQGFGNHQFRMTDKEKTIVDGFDLPKYSGGYEEIIKGFYNARLSSRKLVKYCKAINNISLVKRLAYLTELFDKPKMEYFIKYALSVRNEKYNLFEHNGEKKGKTNRRWRLVMNLSNAEIKNLAELHL